MLSLSIRKYINYNKYNDNQQYGIIYYTVYLKIKEDTFF